MVKATFKNNVLTVVTDLEAKLVTKKPIVLTDREERPNFVVGMSGKDSTDWKILNNEFKGNTAIDGKLAIVAVFPASMTEEKIKDTYGDALLIAETALMVASHNAELTAAGIDEIFSEETEVQEDQFTEEAAPTDATVTE